MTSDSPNKTRALRCLPNIRLQHITVRGTLPLQFRRPLADLLPEGSPFSKTNEGARKPMNCNASLTVRPRCFFALALLLAAANLAYSASPDITFSPATLNFKYQLGS